MYLAELCHVNVINRCTQRGRRDGVGDAQKTEPTSSDLKTSQGLSMV